MIRVTHNMMKNDVVHNLDVHQRKLDELSNNLSTGKKVRVPEENPVAATHAMLYRTRINEIQQFMKNIEEGQSRLNIAEGSIKSVTDIFHRLEELAVESGNGTYTRDDRAKVAVEVDELLKELVEVGNAKFKGESVFAGFQVNKNAFEVQKARPQFADREVIMKVTYNGDVGKMNREIEQQEYSPINLAGNNVFWATEDAVVGSVDVSNYTADKNYKMNIDGKVVQINSGDNINAIMEKINNANVPVRASLSNNQFVLKTTTPKELWLEDIEGGNLLQQLGLKDVFYQKPNETSQNASRVGMSIFDVVIKFRNDLWQDNVKDIGGTDLGNIQKSLGSILTGLGEIGARSHRFDTVLKKLNMDEVDMTDVLAKTENIDFTQVVMDLQMLDYVHRSALATGARIMRPTLIDFLR
ncbi:MAG: flagellar hook-associated protein 3 [bacterium]|nr:flagellar hook-associated protein 3 [bacterium]